MTRDLGPQPPYQRIKRHIVSQIGAGKWAVGHRIPSESDLTAEFGVSRMTVNRALRDLAQDGTIVRVQGVGSFVAAPRAESTVLEVRNIADDIRARGQRHDCVVLYLAAEQNREMAHRLGLRGDAACFHSIHIHKADGVPVQIEDRWINPEFAPDYLDHDLTRETPNAVLTARGAVQFAEHEVEAQQPDAQTRAWLKLRHGESCLVLHRRTWARGMVASVARLVHPGSRHRFTSQVGWGRPAGVTVAPL